jgi:glycerophosphodiester phosphodiesterase
VPEWSSSYINYKGLKKLIKAAAASAKNNSDVDLAGIEFAHKETLLGS